MVQGIDDVSGLLTHLSQANNARFKAEAQISASQRINGATDNAAGLVLITRADGQFIGNLQAHSQ